MSLKGKKYSLSSTVFSDRHIKMHRKQLKNPKESKEGKKNPAVTCYFQVPKDAPQHVKCKRFFWWAIL